LPVKLRSLLILVFLLLNNTFNIVHVSECVTSHVCTPIMLFGN